MGCVPGFEHDLFVSYAHIDDEADVGQAVGWVSTLKDNLKARLDRRLGIRSSVWMDQRLVAESRLSEPIMTGLRQSAGLLVVLSRAYLNSPWCAHERGGFLDGLHERRTMRRPVFVVECDDLARERLPAAFGDLLGVRFWQRQTDGAAPGRLGDPLPTLEDRSYWARLNDLSFKVAEGLSRLRDVPPGHAAAPAAEASPGRPAVFLAEVGDDLMDEYERLQRSLEQAGLLVLPDRAYPRTDADSHAAAMLQDLRRCSVFVQLLGAYPGRVRGWDIGLSALQLQTARRAGVPLRRWRRFGLAADDIRDEAHRQSVFAADVVSESLEVFTAGLLQATRKASSPPAPAAADLLVFVNHDRSDARVAAELCDFFDTQGLGFLRPEPQDSAEAMRADLEDNLRLCDGLVVVYGSTQPVWVRQQLKETLKIKSVRERPLGRVLLCQAEPDEDKPDPGIKLPNQRIIDCRRGLDARARQALDDFVRDLRGVSP